MVDKAEDPSGKAIRGRGDLFCQLRRITLIHRRTGWESERRAPKGKMVLTLAKVTLAWLPVTS